MQADELREQLKSIIPDIETINAYWQNSGLEQKFQELDALSTQEDFWQHSDQASILKELQRVRLLRDQYIYIQQSNKELAELIELFNDDEKELSKIQPDVNELTRTVKKFKISLLLSDPQDSSDCF